MPKLRLIKVLILSVLKKAGIREIAGVSFIRRSADEVAGQSAGPADHGALGAMHLVPECKAF